MTQFATFLSNTRRRERDQVQLFYRARTAGDTRMALQGREKGLAISRTRVSCVLCTNHDRRWHMTKESIRRSGV